MKFPRFQLARRKRVNVFLIKQCQATDYRQQLIANHPWDDTAKVVKRFDTSKYLIAFLQTTSKYQHKIEHLHRKRKIVRESRKVLHILHFFHFDFPFSFSLHFCHIAFDIQQLAVKGQQRETSPYSPPMWFNDFSRPLLLLFMRQVDSVNTYQADYSSEQGGPLLSSKGAIAKDEEGYR